MIIHPGKEKFSDEIRSIRVSVKQQVVVLLCPVVIVREGIFGLLVAPN